MSHTLLLGQPLRYVPKYIHTYVYLYIYKYIYIHINICVSGEQRERGGMAADLAPRLLAHTLRLGLRLVYGSGLRVWDTGAVGPGLHPERFLY